MGSGVTKSYRKIGCESGAKPFNASDTCAGALAPRSNDAQLKRTKTSCMVYDCDSDGTAVVKRKSEVFKDPGCKRDVDEYLPPSENLIHVGVVWKLNHGEDPYAAEEWLKRRMWLTRAGALFYFSRHNNMPLGRPIAGLTFKVPEGKVLGRFIVEVHAAHEELADGHPTVLALETEEERDVWANCLRAIQGKEDDDVGFGLDHFVAFAGSGRRERRGLRNSAGGDMEHVWPSSPSRKVSKECTPLPGGSGTERGTYVRRKSSIFDMSEEEITSSEHLKRLRRDRSNTVLVLDWDDTIFPTTFVRKDCGLDWRYSVEHQVRPGPARDELEAALKNLGEKVETLIRYACKVATVVIVTLAKSPWVVKSMQNFMPNLEAVLRECKAIAMQGEFKSMYGASEGAIKNLISFGDSDFERLALQSSAEEFVTVNAEGGTIGERGLTSQWTSQDGSVKRLYAKTVKMLEEPSCEELVAEVVLLTSWLDAVVNKDEGFDVVLPESSDDARLNELNTQITGRSYGVTWVKLAGLSEDEGGVSTEVPDGSVSSTNHDGT